MKYVIVSSIVLLCSVSLGFGFPEITSPNDGAEQIMAQEMAQVETSTSANEDEFVALDDMHHFMEYVSQPSYKALKELLAKEPENRRAYRNVKVHAMILAETSAIVAARGPEDDKEKMENWKKICLDVHKHGKNLYEAAGKSDFASVKKHYGAMIEACNQCHKVFDNGKHQLEK